MTSHFRFFAVLLLGMLLQPSNAGLKEYAFYKAFGVGSDDALNNATALKLPQPPNLQTPTLEEAQHYAHYSSAAYCFGELLSSYTCIQCKASGPSVRLIKVLSDVASDTQGTLTLDDSREEIVVAIRGTENLWNLVDDVKTTLVASPYGDPGVEIHQGFKGATDSLYDDVLAGVKATLASNPKYKVVLTGHSLGASMAALTYFYLKHDLPDVTYELYTFGQPRTGNQGFANWMNSQNIKLARVVNKGDFIPHIVRAQLGYAHHLREFWTEGETKICSDEYYEDPKCSNSLSRDVLNADDHDEYFGVVQGSCQDGKKGVFLLAGDMVKSLWSMV